MQEYTNPPSFACALLQWYDSFGRKHLPWQNPRTPYRVWISEVMLQQTQVETVIPYFQRFMQSFPELKDLALAAEDEVFAHWSGLGFYARARNMHRCAKILWQEFSGSIPQDLKTLMSLPGIGPSTAAAIGSLAFQQRTAIMDGNVSRVLSRYFMLDGNLSEAKTQKRLWILAQQCMEDSCVCGPRCADYTQAIMDLGAGCCTKTKPSCSICPLSFGCQAYIQAQVEHYPKTKIKKAPPKKEQQFLVLHTQERKIYLEKRPPQGVWGGLWCLPVVEEKENPLDFIKSHLQLLGKSINPLLSFQHKFSHFHLKINALSIEVKEDLETLELREPKGSWFLATELRSLGLAKPVETIIRHFFEK